MAGSKIASGIALFILVVAVILAYFNPQFIKESTLKPKEIISKLTSRIAEFYYESTDRLPKGDTHFPKEIPKETDKNEDDRVDRIFGSDELSQYDGSAGSPGLYLAVLGLVYDVEKGSQHYRPGSSYGSFTGKDASRAFVTGDFTEKGLTDDIIDLPEDQILGIQEWAEFYDKEYTYVGKVTGRYYDQNGNPTEYKQKVEDLFQKALEKTKKETEDREIFPTCNSEWSHDLGGRVWCTTMSGGTDRGWVGVPRQLFTPGVANPRCACVRNDGPPSTAQKSDGQRGDLDHPHLKEYPDCPSDSETCDLKKK